MTEKQKVLTLLEPYRDKTLSFGCEVEHKNYAVTKVIYRDSKRLILCSVEGRNIQYLDESDLTILGHPLTHADLLRGLGDAFFLDGKGTLWATKVIPDKGFEEICTIPLTHRTIEDIPEDDPMWSSLLEVLENSV